MKTRARFVRYAIRSLLVLCIVSAFGCFNDPLTPVTPRWDTNLTLPISNRTVTLQEIVEKDSTFLKAGVGNQLVYTTSAATSPTYVRDNVSITASPVSGSVRLGSFQVIVAPIAVPVQIPGFPAGSTMVVPATAFQAPDIANAISNPGSIQFGSGTVRLTLTNNLPFPVTVDTTICIWDGVVAQARFVFGAVIPAGGSAWAEDDLTGDRIANGQSLIGLHFRTTGSNGSPVTIPPTAITAVFSTSNLIAVGGTVTNLPAQRVTNLDVASMAIRDSTRVQSVTVRSGRLDFTFTSRLAVGVRYRFRINELKRPGTGGAVTFEDSVALPAMGSLAYQVSLGGYTLASLNPGLLLDSVKLISSMIIPAPVIGTVTLHDTDKVLVSMRSGIPVIADTARVVLKPTWVDINTVVPLNFGSLPKRFSGQLSIPSATLALNLISSVGFPADLAIRVMARKATGDTAVLVLPQGQQRILPGNATVRFADADVGQFLTQLSAKLPDSARIVGKILLNPPDVYNPTPAGAASIGRNSSVAGTMSLRVPMTVGISNGVYQDTVSWGDTNADGTRDDSFDRASLNDVNAGKMYAEIRNGTPLQLGVSLRLLDRARTSLLLIPLNGSELHAAAATVDANGNASVPSNSSMVIELQSADIRQFIPAEFVRYALSITSAAGSSTVSLRTTDAITIRIWSQFSYRVNP